MSNFSHIYTASIKTNNSICVMHIEYLVLIEIVLCPFLGQ